MSYEYNTSGVCSKHISFDLDDAKNVHNVEYIGGCNGNLKAIGKLVEGKPAEEVISILKGNTCGHKNTSCGDQLAVALEEALAK